MKSQREVPHLSVNSLNINQIIFIKHKCLKNLKSHYISIYPQTGNISNLLSLNEGRFLNLYPMFLHVVLFTMQKKETGWDKIQLHLEWGRHFFLWLSDGLPKSTEE